MTMRYQPRQIQRILVTGGLGFIGKHLCKRLLDLGYIVISLDDESASTDDAPDFILDKCKTPERFRQVCGSILDISLVQGVMSQSVDLVFHLAAKLGVENVVKNRLETLETNVLGTMNVLEAASQFKIPTFVASSSEVYGKSEVIPFKEDANLILGPSSVSRWGYAASKIMDEHEALARYEEDDLPVVVGRFFNIVGPGQPPESGMVIPKMISAAQEGSPIRVLGNGQQQRCFCHVADAVEALCKLMLSQDSKVYGKIFNIGNPKNEITMFELGKLIQEVYSSTSRLELVPYNEVFKDGSFEDMARRVPDIKKIEEAVGWKPKKHLHMILADIAKHEAKLKRQRRESKKRGSELDV